MTNNLATIDVVRAAFRDRARMIAEAASGLDAVLATVIDVVGDRLLSGGTLLVCGNGGSAADAQHLAAELVCRVRTDRRALPAVALTTDSSTLTAIANDYGFERVFARQVEALARPGDLLLAISTSGNSANVIEAARVARERDCTVIAMTGRGGGALAPLAHHLLAVPDDVVSRIQEVHAVCIHVLAEAVEARVSNEESSR